MAITQTFEYGLIKASEAEERAQERGENGFNVFSALKLGEKENAHSDFIAYLLNAKGEHNQSVFLNEFLAKLEKEKIDDKFFENLILESVERESVTRNINKNRRVDILMRFDNDKFIIIENKICAKDENLQVKEYISDKLNKKDKNEKSIPPQNILFIYLHPDTDEVPSDESLGDWKIQENTICDKKGTMQSHYFKMDYYWIKEWLECCVYKLNKEQREFGKNGFGKIVVGVEQYIELLQNEPSILDEQKEINAVLEFVMQKDEYQKMALEILDNMLDTKHDLHEILTDSWDKISKNIVEKFYDDLLKEFEKGVKIGKDIYKADRTDDEIGKTGWQVVFYKKAREEFDLDYVIAFGYDKSKFAMPHFAYGAWYYHSEKYDKIVNKCNDFFKDNRKNGIRKDGGCYYKYILNETDKQEYEFVKWIIEQNGNAVAEFKAKLTEFIQLETIQETMQQVEKYISENL